MAVSEIYNSDEVSRGYQEILAGCLSPSKGKRSSFFSGPKNYGQVISKVTTRGKYDPDKSEINFAVPDERQLCSQDRILGRIIQPGLIDASMNMLKNHKDIVLMADC